MTNKLTSEIPTDIQEKLAWGISNYNPKAIEEALDAGANPFTCHKTQLAGSYLLKNRIEVVADTEELSPYYILFYTPQLTKLNSKSAAQAILHTAEVLLKRGISVDNKPTNPSHGFGDTFTFRQQVNEWLKEFENTLKNQTDTLTQEQKVTLSQQATIAKKLLTLMKKYQPEDIETLLK